MPISPDLEVNIGSLTLRNPVMTASGTFGYGQEFAAFVNFQRLGAVVAKGISLAPRQGNPPPRVVETPCGMLNAIGLENVGLESFLLDKLPYLHTLETRVIVNILGESPEEYRQLAERLGEIEEIDAIEVNISCPNVKKGGVAFGTDPLMARQITEVVCRHCRQPVIVKLSPNVTDVRDIARAAEDGGAAAVSLINTVLGMAIDINSRRPKLANIVGGLSGPAIRPIAVRMVWQVAQAVNIPVIGIGGITCAEDAIEFLLAGATAVEVGTANFVNPRVTEEVVAGLERYLTVQGLKSARELIGAVIV